MNLYEKIQEVRVKLANTKIQMTGDNKFAGYKYFELDDFLKPLNEYMREVKMTAYASFTAESATLTAVNSEKPEETLTISSPLGSAALKGCHEVQNIGAVETYQRRYLYQALFDIAESDGLNATQGKEEKQGNDGKKAAEKPKILKPTTNALPFPEDGVNERREPERAMSLSEAESIKIKVKSGEEKFVKDLTTTSLAKLITSEDPALREQRRAARVIYLTRQSAVE